MGPNFVLEINKEVYVNYDTFAAFSDVSIVICHHHLHLVSTSHPRGSHYTVDISHLPQWLSIEFINTWGVKLIQDINGF